MPLRLDLRGAIPGGLEEHPGRRSSVTPPIATIATIGVAACLAGNGLRRLKFLPVVQPVEEADNDRRTSSRRRHMRACASGPTTSEQVGEVTSRTAIMISIRL